jgi:hypothetical protein
MNRSPGTNDAMPEVTLTLTLDETNLVLESLGQMPFVQVHQLIAKIHEQAESQVAASANVVHESPPKTHPDDV